MREQKFIVMLFITFLVGTTNLVNAQSKSQIKSAEKAAKSEAKDLRKQGWKLDGSLPLETALKNHYLKKTDFGGTGTEYVGNSPTTNNLKLGARQARSDIRTQYAEETSAIVKGRINDGSADIEGEQAENFVSAYETMVMKEIDGVLMPSFTIYREKKDGKFEVKVYFLLDEVKANNARKRALKNAAENQNISQKIASDMSDFINEGFKGLKTE